MAVADPLHILVAQHCATLTCHPTTDGQFTFAPVVGAASMFQPLKAKATALGHTLTPTLFNQILSQITTLHLQTRTTNHPSGTTIADHLLLPGETIALPTGTTAIKMAPRQYLLADGHLLQTDQIEGHLLTPTPTHLAIGIALMHGYWLRPTAHTLWPLAHLTQAMRSHTHPTDCPALIAMAIKMGIGPLPLLTITNAARP